MFSLYSEERTQESHVREKHFKTETLRNAKDWIRVQMLRGGILGVETERF